MLWYLSLFCLAMRTLDSLLKKKGLTHEYTEKDDLIENGSMAFLWAAEK